MQLLGIISDGLKNAPEGASLVVIWSPNALMKHLKDWWSVRHRTDR